MEYISVAEAAEKWKVSERSVRNYCAEGRVSGACLAKGQWLLPKHAAKPERRPRRQADTLPLRLQQEKESGLSGGIYHKLQVEFAYNSNHIEGSRLTHEQTRFIYETNTIGVQEEAVNVNDIIEAANHFRCFDYVLEQAGRPLSEGFIKKLHAILKAGTADSRRAWFAVGDYKRLPNEAGGAATAAPGEVAAEMKELLRSYNRQKKKTLEDIIDFHYRLEKIHPFQDGNGRVGRLVMFKECLRNGIVPFIIEDDLKLFYYRGLREYQREPGYLVETCLSAQDRFKAYLDYFQISY